MSEQISGIADNSMKHLKELVDVDSVVGSPITTPDGTTILPVSKVTFGFGSGGSDLPSSPPKTGGFGGGSGGGVTIHPMGFLVIGRDGNVKMINISESKGAGDRIVSMMPEMIDKISGIIQKEREKASDHAAPTGVDTPQ